MGNVVICCALCVGSADTAARLLAHFMGLSCVLIISLTQLYASLA